MQDSMVKQIKVMISSTRADLMQYREVASKLIAEIAREKEEQVQLVEVSMEKETQTGEREFAVAVSKNWVEEADWMVLIVGWHYGTVSTEEGANGLSVTAWEYRHAMAKNKKVFVFIAGDPGTANQYRVSPEESQDLKDWSMSQTPEQKTKLDEFKQELSGRHVEFFANLPMFCTRLGKTLKDAIDHLPPQIQPGDSLDVLLVAVTPDIRNCIRKVKLIANCKQIHDNLHEIRQHVIIPLREEVLSQWKEEGELSRSREKVIWRCVTWSLRQMDGIRRTRKMLDNEEHWVLSESVDRVLNWPGLWDLEVEMGMEEFSESLDGFAEAIQDAFSEADRCMAEEESDLREGYLKLLDTLKKERRRIRLEPFDNQRLDEELIKIKRNREQVQNALANHHRWQESHDKLYELDAFRETKLFAKKFKHFCESWLPTKLLPLVGNEMERVSDDERRDVTAGQPCSSGAAGGALTTQPCPDVCLNFIDRLQNLKSWLGKLAHEDGIGLFDEIRKPFDDSFFCVDKRTLEGVGHAEERVHDLEHWLDDLARRRLELD